MTKKIDKLFDERDYRFRRLELLIYGLYAIMIFFLGLPYLLIAGLFS